MGPKRRRRRRFRCQAPYEVQTEMLYEVAPYPRGPPPPYRPPDVRGEARIGRFMRLMWCFQGFFHVFSKDSGLFGWFFRGFGAFWVVLRGFELLSSGLEVIW